MISALATVLLLALSRAELVARMKAPVITQCEGYVQVFADCPEDMRREYQMPIAGFVSDTVRTLARAYGVKERRFRSPGIIVHVGDVRTNDASVVSRVSTNETQIVTRLYVPAPGAADLDRLRAEVACAWWRTFRGGEIAPAAALEAYRATDPRRRVADERADLEAWLSHGACRHDRKDAEHYLHLMRKVIEPGVASRRDVLTFASRLYLYPATYDERFLGELDQVAFRDAVQYAVLDPQLRLAAQAKAAQVMAFGGGRGEKLEAAAQHYSVFLMGIAAGNVRTEDLLKLLTIADGKLQEAYDEAERLEREGKTR